MKNNLIKDVLLSSTLVGLFFATKAYFDNQYMQVLGESLLCIVVSNLVVTHAMKYLHNREQRHIESPTPRPFLFKEKLQLKELIYRYELQDENNNQADIDNTPIKLDSTMLKQKLE